MSLEESLCQLGTINLPLGTHQAHKLAVEHQFADQPAKAGLKRRHLRPIHALSFGQPYGFILNFWQRYASHATAVPEACVANKGHAGVSVAKLCFPNGKIILQGTRSTGCRRCWLEHPGLILSRRAPFAS